MLEWSSAEVLKCWSVECVPGCVEVLECVPSVECVPGCVKNTCWSVQVLKSGVCPRVRGWSGALKVFKCWIGPYWIGYSQATSIKNYTIIHNTFFKPWFESSNQFVEQLGDLFLFAYIFFENNRTKHYPKLYKQWKLGYIYIYKHCALPWVCPCRAGVALPCRFVLSKKLFVLTTLHPGVALPCRFFPEDKLFVLFVLYLLRRPDGMAWHGNQFGMAYLAYFWQHCTKIQTLFIQVLQFLRFVC